ncbi:hypothetical protein [Vibrio phage BONAISHI]|nr:hypothetical protein [Vibrio phage BONAISHI]
MTTIVLARGNLASDRMCVEYTNHFMHLRKKSAVGTNGTVGIAIGGKARTNEILVKLADMCEALDWIDIHIEENEEKYKYLRDDALALSKSLAELLDEDSLFVVYRSRGKVKMCYAEGHVGNSGDLDLKSLFDDSYQTYGTGAAMAEFEIRHQYSKGIEDYAVLFEVVSSIEECTSKEHDVIYGEDLKDIAEVKEVDIKIKELLK